MKLKHKRTNQTIKKVKVAIHEEKEAVKDYRKDAKKADSKTAKLFRHIGKQEQHHRNELTKRLSEIKSKK